MMPGSVEEWESLRLDNVTLKTLGNSLAKELSVLRGRKKELQKELIELQLIIKSNNTIMGNLRERCVTLRGIADKNKGQIFELTATLLASQLEAKSKGDYIDKYMRPLKDDAQHKHRQARKAVEIIRSVKDKVIENGPITWSKSEILNLIDTTAERINNEPIWPDATHK